MITGLIFVLQQHNGPQWYLGLPAQIAAFGALLTAIGAAITGWSTRRKLKAESVKTGAEAAKVLSDTALELLDPYREQVAHLRPEQEQEAARVHRQMEKMRADLEAAAAEVLNLRRQLAEANREIAALRSDLGHT